MFTFTSFVPAGSGFQKSISRRRRIGNASERRLDIAVIETLESRVLLSDAAFTAGGPNSPITQIAGGTALNLPKVTTSGTTTATITKTGALPTGDTFTDNGDGTASITGTAGAGTGGAYPITLTAHNATGGGPDATENLTVNVDQTPAITNVVTALTAVAGTGSTLATITATGFPAPTFAIVGTAPTGVAINSVSGVLTINTTGVAGSFNLVISATNGLGSGNKAFTLTTNKSPAITSNDSTKFASGVANSFTITTEGFPNMGTVITLDNVNAHPLPAGVTFTDHGNGSATLSGAPASATNGTYGLVFRASNGIAPDATQSFKLTVDNAHAPSIKSASHLTLQAGSAASFTVTTTGVPTAALSLTGILPVGMTYADNGDGTGTLSGTPATGSGGVYTLTLRAHNGVGSDAVQTFKLTVEEPLVFTSTNAATFVVGVAHTFNVVTTGFPVGSHFSITGGLPSGLKLTDNHNGTATISGTAKVGTGKVYDFTVTARGSDGTVEQKFVLTVQEAPTLKGFTSAPTVNMNAHKLFNRSFSLNGFPTPAIISAIVGLPAGLTLDIESGKLVLKGTPTVAASADVTFTLTNADHSHATLGVAIDIVVRA